MEQQEKVANSTSVTFSNDSTKFDFFINLPITVIEEICWYLPLYSVGALAVVNRKNHIVINMIDVKELDGKIWKDKNELPETTFQFNRFWHIRYQQHFYNFVNVSVQNKMQQGVNLNTINWHAEFQKAFSISYRDIREIVVHPYNRLIPIIIVTSRDKKQFISLIKENQEEEVKGLVTKLEGNLQKLRTMYVTDVTMSNMELNENLLNTTDETTPSKKGASAWLWAYQSKNLSMISFFSTKAKPPTSDGNEIIVAIQNGLDDAAIYAIDNRIQVLNGNPSTTTRLGRYLLESIKCRRLNVIRHLVEKGTRYVHVVDPNQEWGSVIQNVIENNYLALIKCLVEEVNMPVDGNPAKFIPLNNAIFLGKIEIAEYLLEQGANPNLMLSDDIRGNSALHRAVNIGNLELVQRLVEKGAVINIGNAGGKTPLFLAAQNNNAAIFMYLLEQGADITMTTKNEEYPMFSNGGFPESVKAPLKNIIQQHKNLITEIDEWLSLNNRLSVRKPNSTFFTAPLNGIQEQEVRKLKNKLLHRADEMTPLNANIFENGPEYLQSIYENYKALQSLQQKLQEQLQTQSQESKIPTIQN